ncbi:multiple monosaccharide ABC transporter permease [Allonocardiopsis opalescens]|uniref:Xylose transport system permease protein XylH n=1 Tax=Allonocardiopsis opalescens TaxID=1144618 RepID=A0A2T0QEC9_9ACTN|nr:multiple monosaccharide ABC transporter permease [Allonocardiopsis opalescens]PRY02296.1 multiple monosaccharide ABC transporter membrane protein [Allonocardiopsis opalescens]
MGAVRELLRNNARQYGMLMALVVIAVLFGVLTQGLLLQPANINNLIMQNGYILILAIGMMLVIITGHIDLSVGSVAAFVGATSAVLMTGTGLPPYVVVVLALLLGGLIGAWQGFWVAYVRIPAFIVTLAGMLLFRGLTMILLGGETVAPLPASFRAIGSGFVPDVVVELPYTIWLLGITFDELHVFALLFGAVASALVVLGQLLGRRRLRRHGLSVGSRPWFIVKLVVLVAVLNAFTFMLAVHNGVPVIGVVLVVLIVGYSFVMNRMTIGRRVYAVGGNEKAAMLSGVRTKPTTFWVFVNMGVLSALAGLVFAARLNAATPRAGNLFELDAIAAAFIGGASATGGVGTVVGAVIGAMVMGLMNNGMSIIGLGVDWQQAIKGLVLLVAVAFDIFNKNRVRASRTAAAAASDGSGGTGADPVPAAGANGSAAEREPDPPPGTARTGGTGAVAGSG